MDEKHRGKSPGGGVLQDQALEDLKRRGAIQGHETHEAQPASLDLHLDRIGYRLQASFLPGQRRTVAECAKASCEVAPAMRSYSLNAKGNLDGR